MSIDVALAAWHHEQREASDIVPHKDLASQTTVATANSAFNALGKPARSTALNWLRDGVLTLPLALWLAGWFGASGVIYAQAGASVLVGTAAAWWGWVYVRSLQRLMLPPVSVDPPRPYAHADRFRRR